MNQTELQNRMAVNLARTFELLDTVLELKVAYLKKIYPDKTEKELIHKIHLDVIAAKERAWKKQTA